MSDGVRSKTMLDEEIEYTDYEHERKRLSIGKEMKYLQELIHLYEDQKRFIAAKYICLYLMVCLQRSVYKIMSS